MSPTFAQLGVPEAICRALEANGITSPFAIQAATIEDSLAGFDVCGRAPTGSGKTLAFGIPLVVDIERASPKRPSALVLAPTRELADQIHVELKTFSGDVRIGVVYGGVGYGPQIKSLRDGIEVLVACPGRLEDLIQQGHVDLSNVSRVVLDEADRMADMGFMPAVRRLLDATADDRQTVLFSATLDGDVAKLTRDYQHDPVRHEVGDETPDVTSAHHVFWKSSQDQRTDLTAEAINAVWPAIVFCRTRHGADRLAKRLGRSGVQAAAIHGGRSQGQRTRALGDFTKNRVHALIATDVAARGIHVDGVAAVIHFDPPEDHKTYVHRSGRTARAGEGGVVVSLVQPNQTNDVRKMARKIGIHDAVTVPDAHALRGLSSTPAPERTPSEVRASEPAEDRPQGNRGQGPKRNGSRHGSNGRGRSGSAGGRNRRQGSGNGNGGGRGSSKGGANSRSRSGARSASRSR